ncbi:MAG TPA: hypothetical protein VGB90_00330 [Alphaproteobacteria bacterium]
MKQDTIPRPANDTLHGDASRLRDLLRALPNPDEKLDYIVRLAGTVAHAAGGNAHLTLHYVPDRLIADAAGFTAYLEALGQAAHATLEGLGACVIEDVNNALVPRWVRIALTADSASAGSRHAVLIEDAQPGWSNEPLLSVLAPF